MKKIRYENVALLALAAVFSVIATVVLSGFLEPSQPPAVAAVQIGSPREDAGHARERADAGHARERADGRERPRRGRAAADASPRADGSSPSREPRQAPSPQPSPASAPEPAPLLPIAPAERDDDAGEPAEADDAGD